MMESLTSDTSTSRGIKVKITDFTNVTDARIFCDLGVAPAPDTSLNSWASNSKLGHEMQAGTKARSHTDRPAA
jgi:hypothetical protein